MSNQQHTPGPWKLNGAKVVTENGTPVASAEYYGIHGAGVSDANARLIAAAPELLAALEWSVRFIETYATKQAGPATPELNKARAAIAKAKGQP